MATQPADDEARETQTSNAAGAGRSTPPAPGSLGRRNRALALILATVAATTLVFVVILAALFHYVEIHHVLANL